MHITTKQNNPTKITLTIVADSKDLSVVKDAVLKELANTTKVSGFREGKAPLSVVEKNVDDQVLQSKVVDKAVNKLYVNAVRKSDIRPVGAPQVTLKKFVPYTELEFDAATEVIGKIDLPNYKSIKKKQEKPTVTADDVKKVLEDLQAKGAEKVDVKRAAKNGNQVTIDFSGKDEKGNAISGADGKDYPLTLGSNTFIPGFEENIVGLKAGEDKVFDISFPKDYGVKALANKKAKFTVIVKNVQELKKAKLDDEFAKKIGSFENLAALKKDIKTQLQQEKETQATRALENSIVNEIVDKSKVDLPESLIDEQLGRLKTEVKQNLVYKDQTWQEMLELEGMTEEEFDKAKLKPEAEQRVKTGLVLSEISHNEKIDVTPEEVDMRMQLLKGQYTDPAMKAELDKPETKQDIASRMITEKTLEHILSIATNDK
ncbi:trigger factor [Candidatus Saccharibacteria bacterium]|nr:trigger factor [Candidatus Saccharibacteria bacterium]